MRKPFKPTAKPFSLGRGLFLGTVSILIMVAPQVAAGDPPATVATCEGIENAYQILGTKCENAYDKISHAPINATERLNSYKARKEVMIIFQKALLCNGMFGAQKPAQNRFKSAEDGHLQAILNLHNAMVAAGDPNIPPLFTKANLKSIKIKKQQCK